MIPSFGFSREFAEPTLLFFGNAEAIAQLRSAIASLKAGSSIDFDDPERFLPLHGLKLRLIGAETENRLYTDRLGEHRSIRWCITESKAKAYLSLLDELVACPGGGHQYLDGDSLTDAAIAVSIDEYPADLRPLDRLAYD